MHEFALALVLVKHFSDTGNVLYNAGLVDENGNTIDVGADQNLLKPVRKRRKKMQVKETTKNVQKSYYALVLKLKQEKLKDGYDLRMKTWDDMLCQHRCPTHSTTAQSRPNTVPQEFRVGIDEHSLARDFFNDLFGSYPRDGASSTSSPSSSDTSVATNQLTQPEHDSVPVWGLYIDP